MRWPHPIERDRSSIWADAPAPASGYELLDGARCDAIVVGAGIAGLSIALELASAGERVIVVDAGPIAGGESARSTGHLASALDDRYHVLERVHGARGARLAAASHAAAIDRIEALVVEHRIACGFERVDGYLFAPPGADRRELDDELAAARRAGLEVDQVGSPLDHFEVGPCLRFADQAQLDPRRYLAGLAHAILALGGELHPGVRVVAVEDGAPAHVVCADGRRLHADAVILASHTPTGDRGGLLARLHLARSYVVACEVARGAAPDALLWDLERPYHYVRQVHRPGAPSVLLIGGEDHPADQAVPAERCYDRLEAWARQRITGLGERVRAWSGRIAEPDDGLAYLGRCPGEGAIYLATGDSGNGATHAVIAGVILRELVCGRGHPWAALYDPARVAPGLVTRPPPSWPSPADSPGVSRS